MDTEVSPCIVSLSLTHDWIARRTSYSDCECILNCAWDNSIVPLLQYCVLESVDSDLTQVLKGSHSLLQIEVVVAEFPDDYVPICVAESASVF